MARRAIYWKVALFCSDCVNPVRHMMYFGLQRDFTHLINMNQILRLELDDSAKIFKEFSMPYYHSE